MKLSKLYIICLLLLTSSLFLSGCSQKKESPIVTINDIKLYKSDFLYDIYLVEKEGNQLEKYYQNKLGISYWDYELSGSTMREMAKSSLLSDVVMHDILYKEAKTRKMKFSKKEMSAVNSKIDILLKDSEDELTKIGLTRDVITKDLLRITVADKYKNYLCKDFKIDEASIRNKIDRSDYSTDKRYEQAVKDEIALEKDRLFDPIYQKIKDKYDITINYDYWDTITIGSITSAN